MEHPGKHIVKQFDEELKHIRKQIMKMGNLVEIQLTKAISTLLNHDVELAKKVIKKDHEVNKLEVAIDEACVKIIAKRQPAAGSRQPVI